MKKKLRWRLVITLVLLLFALVGIVVQRMFHPLSHLTPYGELSPALMPTAEYLERNPIQQPAFISRADSRPDDDNEICVGLVLSTLPSNTPSAEVDLYAGKNLYIDGYLAGGDMIGTIQVLGLCVDVSGLSAGLHLASVDVTTRDGVEHTYMWAFRIDPTPDA